MQPNATQPLTVRWPVKTSEHLDLWLHAFALLTDDSAAVPSFRLGYRDSLTVVKNRANVLTLLDANRIALAKGLAASGGYQRAQFLPMDMTSWDVLRTFAERFLQSESGGRRASDTASVARAVQFAEIFRTAADREWLRLFVASVGDEQLRFFADEHARTVRNRVAVITAVDSLWQKVYRVKFDRFLMNTGQQTGDIVLSLPVGGEGRIGVGRSGQIVVAVPFPQRIADATDVLFVLAHEITGSLVMTVVDDNFTRADQRAGIADGLISISQVRAGAMLLARVAPALLEPYMRYYLEYGRARVSDATSGSALTAAFNRRYELPATIRDDLQRQLEIVLDGI